MAEDDRRDVNTDVAPVDVAPADAVPANVAPANIDSAPEEASRPVESSPLDDVKAEVERILTGVTNDLQTRDTTFDMPIVDERRSLALYTEAVRMQVKLHATTDYVAVQELRIAAVGLESRYKVFSGARITKLMCALLALLLLASTVVWHTQIIDTIKWWFGDNKPLKFITIGLSGFMLYWIGRASRYSETLTGKSGVVLDMIVGVIAAVVVPPVIVILFFDTDGTLREFKPSPELLSFLCGYSLKVILDFLAKVIEKVNAAVRAL
ncbi:hypothetical protein [Azospirillum sp. sgz301742]